MEPVEDPPRVLVPRDGPAGPRDGPAGVSGLPFEEGVEEGEPARAEQEGQGEEEEEGVAEEDGRGEGEEEDGPDEEVQGPVWPGFIREPPM